MDIQERHPRNCQDAVTKALKERLHSRETLIHVGFSPEKADKVWQRWTNWSSGDLEPHREGDPDHGRLEMAFLDFFTGFITSQNDTWSSEDAEWVRCMNSYGISKELQDAILDLMFQYIRLSESYAWWAHESICMRHAALKVSLQTSQPLEQIVKPQLDGSGTAELPSSSFQLTGNQQHFQRPRIPMLRLSLWITPPLRKHKLSQRKAHQIE